MGDKNSLQPGVEDDCIIQVRHNDGTNQEVSMKQSYDCFTKAGGLFFGFLVVGEDIDEEGIFHSLGFDIRGSGIFHGVLIYFPTEGGMAMKEFYSAKSSDDTISKADTWIKANLYPDFVRGSARNLGSHVV
jgi:hypothetical protein